LTEPLELAPGVWLVGQFVDGLELSWEPPQGGRWGDDARDALDRTLAVLRKSARQARSQTVPSGWTTADGETVRAAGRGVRQSAYQLECSKWIAGVATDGAPGPRAFFQLRSSFLADEGAFSAWREVSSWTDGHLWPLVGRRVEDAEATWRVSRIDLAADVAGLALSGNDLHAFTTRASSRRTYEEPAVSDYERRDFTGFRFGRRGGPIFARIYKKSVEAADDAWVRDAWTAAGYRPGVHGADVWRVEFELRGALLRQLTVDGKWLPRDPGELLSHHLSNLWAYATRQWLVFHERGRTRVERDRVAPWWVALSKLSGFEAEPAGGRLFRRLTPPARNPRHLLLMTVGALTSLAALHGQESWDDVREGLDRYIRRGYGTDAFAAEIRRKSSAYPTLPPLPASWLDAVLSEERLPHEVASRLGHPEPAPFETAAGVRHESWDWS
jgi:hypothetical protein